MAATRVNVPFNFSVAGKTFPAGGYNLVHDSTSPFVTLRSIESIDSYTWLLTPGPPRTTRRLP